MGRVAAIGSLTSVGGYALAGVLVLAAEEPDQVRAAWQRLPGDVSLVILTAEAATALPATALPATGGPLVATLPPRGEEARR